MRFFVAAEAERGFAKLRQPGAPRDSERTWAEMAEMLKDLPVVGCHLMEFTNEVRVSARDTNLGAVELPCLVRAV